MNTCCMWLQALTPPDMKKLSFLVVLLMLSKLGIAEQLTNATGPDTIISSNRIYVLLGVLIIFTILSAFLLFISRK